MTPTDEEATSIKIASDELFTVHSSTPITCLAFHPTIPLVVAGDQSHFIQVWDYEQGQRCNKFQVIPTEEEKRKKVAEADSRAQKSSFDLFQWLLTPPPSEGSDRTESKAFLKAVDMHASSSSEMAVLAAGGLTGVIFLCDYQAGTQLGELEGHEGHINSLKFANPKIDRGNWLLSASDDKTLRIWDFKSRACLSVMTNPDLVTSGCFFTGDPKAKAWTNPSALIASSCADGTIRIWDVTRVPDKAKAPQEDDNNMDDDDKPAPSYCNEFTKALFLGGSPQVALDDTAGGALIKFILEGHEAPPLSARFHPTLPLVLSSDEQGSMKYWRLTPTKAWEVDCHKAEDKRRIPVCMYHNQEDLAVTMNQDGVVSVHDVSSRRLIHQFETHNEHGLVDHPEPNGIFAAASGSEVRVFTIKVMEGKV